MLLAMKVRDYDSLVDAVQLVASELIRGNLSVQTAGMVKECLELAFTAVAAKGKSERGTAPGNALQALFEAIAQPPRALTAEYELVSSSEPLKALR